MALDVLLVEDNDGDALLVERYLARADARLIGEAVTLHRARRLETAGGIVTAKGCEVVLLDLGLAESKGIDTLMRMQQFAPHVPIVVLTGLDDEQIAFEALRQGAEDFLSKEHLDAYKLARALRFAIERNQRKLMTAVVEASDLPIILAAVHDGARSVVFVNEACIGLTGYEAGVWKNQGLAVFCQSCERGQKVMAKIDEAVRNKERKSLEERCFRADGEAFWNRITVIPIAGVQGQVSHILFSFEDISEQRQWRSKMADLDRMTTMATMAIGVAHEVNNPLAYIAGNLQYVRKVMQLHQSPLDEETRGEVAAALEESIQGAERIKSVVSDLGLLASRSGDSSVDVKELSIQRPLELSLLVARNQIRNRAQLSVIGESQATVLGDEALLGQVFLNLLLNAAEAIPKGDPQDHQVEIEIIDDCDKVRVVVRDSGVGIAADAMPHLFEPFYTTKAEGARGLGLPMANQIVTRFSGHIDFASQVGGGTEVTVVLPRAGAGDS